MIFRLALALLIGFLVSACSSGSNSTPVSPPVSPPVVPVGLVIDAANAKPAVRVAYGASLQSADTGDLIGGTGLASTGSGGFSKINPQMTLSATLTRAMQQVPLPPIVNTCASGMGTFTLTGDLAMPGTLTAGDVLNIDFADCDEGLGEVLNGRIEMTVVTFTGDLILGTYLMVMDVLLIDHIVATAADTITSNGDSRVTLDTTGLPIITMSITGLSLTGVSVTLTETISDFSTAQTVDSSTIPEPYTLDAAGTVDSSILSGFIDYDTPVVFQGAGTGYPFAGELLVTGDSGATVRLIALDDMNVRIETDTNGDGVVDATEDTTWDDIAN